MCSLRLEINPALVFVLAGLVGLGLGGCDRGQGGSPDGSPDGGFSEPGGETTYFLAPESFPAPLLTNELLVGDFNRDRRPDLIAAHEFGNLGILLGQASGGFAPSGTAETPELRALTTGDFNGNGDLDLAFATGSLFIYLGTGDGGLFQDTSIPYSDILTMISRDLNGDGKSDLILGRGGFHPGQITVLVADAIAPYHYPLDLPTALVTADFNGDGKLDLAAASSAGDVRSVKIYQGSGQGTFSAGQVYTLGAGAVGSMVVGDFAGSTALDLVLTGDPGQVAVLEGQGDGTFVAGNPYPAGPTGAVVLSLLAEDFTGDRLTDVVAIGLRGGDDPANLTLLVRRPQGGFAAPEMLGAFNPNFVSPMSLGAADTSGDGRPDLVVSNGDHITVYLNKGL